jgi:hypothetical protein
LQLKSQTPNVIIDINPAADKMTREARATFLNSANQLIFYPKMDEYFLTYKFVVICANY